MAQVKFGFLKQNELNIFALSFPPDGPTPHTGRFLLSDDRACLSRAPSGGEGRKRARAREEGRHPLGGKKYFPPPRLAGGGSTMAAVNIENWYKQVSVCVGRGGGGRDMSSILGYQSPSPLDVLLPPPTSSLPDAGHHALIPHPLLPDHRGMRNGGELHDVGGGTCPPCSPNGLSRPRLWRSRLPARPSARVPQVISPFSVYFNSRLIFQKMQLWRLFTNFFFFGNLGA